ncbi:MAG: hypothetical protein MUF18_21110 [Fimbriiglobus sp.]|jgi:hypothetical protein|nr:hypothetical protein [Fimbriiglobus sp.]
MHAKTRQLFAVMVVMGLVAPLAVAQRTSGSPTATISGSTVLVPPANNTVNVTTSGTYDMGRFGAVTKIKVQVRYKHPGAMGWTDVDMVDATVPNPGTTGTFTAVTQGVPYQVNGNQDKTKYEVKAFLYQGTSPNYVLVGDSTGWTSVP